MTAKKLGIAFITGRSRPGNIALGPSQRAFLERVMNGNMMPVAENFPWIPQTESWRDTGLLRASISHHAGQTLSAVIETSLLRCWTRLTIRYSFRAVVDWNCLTILICPPRPCPASACLPLGPWRASGRTVIIFWCRGDRILSPGFGSPVWMSVWHVAIWTISRSQRWSICVNDLFIKYGNSL